MSAFSIAVQDDMSLPEGIVDLLITAVSHTLHHQQILPPAQLTLLLTDDATIQQLNRDFRQVNTTTDVLSFPDGSIPRGMDIPYLGDIAISVPCASHQADQTNHDLASELQLLALHGTLHLLGHDHTEPDEKAAMWTAQQAILKQLGLHHVTPTET